MRFPKATNALFAVALFLPSGGLLIALQSVNSALDSANESRDDARHEAENAKKAAEAAQSTNLQLQQRLTCRSGLAQALDVAVASILLKVTSGNTVDLTAEQASLRKAMDERAQTSERCGG